MNLTIADLLNSPAKYTELRLEKLNQKPISSGDPLPNIQYIGYIKGNPKPQAILTGEIMTSKGRSVVFGLPGAFTKVCTEQHLPGFVKAAKELKEKYGVEKIFCVAADKLDVMRGWGKIYDPDEEITMVPDMYASFALALGLAINRTYTPSYEPRGLGLISKRFVMVLKNNEQESNKMVVESIDVEEDLAVCKRSSASSLLENLQKMLETTKESTTSMESGKRKREDESKKEEDLEIVSV